MTAKSALRLLIACVIVWLILSFALPQVGIPRSRMLPAPLAYKASAKLSAEGTVIKKSERPTSNIFHSMDIDHLVDYHFEAPSVPALGNKPPKEPRTIYEGETSVPQDLYGNTKVGDIVPVKYDPTDPEISAVDLPGASQSIIGHGALLGLWIGILVVVLVLGYLLSPWLERIILRENY